MPQMSWEPIAELLRSSIRKPEERKIGVEIERIALWEDGAALHYRAQKGPKGETRPGAEQLMWELEKRHKWPMTTSEDGEPLGFSAPFGKISLEPGSQLELSAHASPDLFTHAEVVRSFEAQVDAITRPWGLVWVGLGVNPHSKVEDIDVIPSTRYHIMTDYLGKRARLGTSMMRLTSSVQINLDYTSEAEGIEMLRAALAATPVSYALFANSPIVHGKESGWLSYRSAIWRETDPDRTGLLPEAFEDGFDFDAYARLAFKRPLMFAQDGNHHYVPAEGATLADIQSGKRDGIQLDEYNRMNGIREIFTEARLKPGYVEVRSIDGLRACDRYAAVAFWVGLLYSAEARQRVLHHCSAANAKDREALWLAASKEGLAAKAGGCGVRTLAGELVAIARSTLKARGFGEEKFLEPVEQTIEDGMNPAQRILREFHGGWGRSVPKLIRYAGLAGDC